MITIIIFSLINMDRLSLIHKIKEYYTKTDTKI